MYFTDIILHFSVQPLYKNDRTFSRVLISHEYLKASVLISQIMKLTKMISFPLNKQSDTDMKVTPFSTFQEAISEILVEHE